jgi:ketosteroid isomerase-like protein
MSQENVEAVRKSLDGWNRGDVDAWLKAAHPKIEWVSEIAMRLQGSETVFRGPAEMRKYWDEWHSIWNVKIEVSEIRDLGDVVVAIARLQTRGEASGIAIEQPVAWVFEFEGGLARRVRAYLEPREALEAAGLSE